ncbi:MAG: ribonucleoside hydrolase [Haloplasmataceae bacterium]|jgi:non-specific riboncleoside hydrolase|nr:ribonucleoside hydrolase [Haloplasmataceae bacterium]
MSKKRPIIIDTDPGIDDAVAIAIALFSEELDVKLFTTVAGNVNLEKVTGNMLKLLKFWDKSIPVAKGANDPLIRPAIDASDIHGSSGMDGYDFEEGDTSIVLSDHAVNAMYKTLMNSEEKITIVPIGPLTNIALLLKVYPEVKAKIAEIVLMGGSTSRGNKGVMSEFNIAVDPEAAKIVFSSGVPIVMAGLDVGWKALVFPEDSAKIKTFNKTGEMIYSLFQKYRSGGLKNGLRMYDSCAIAYLLKPEMYQVVESFVDVELAGSLTAGTTVVDLKGYLKQPANALVCVDINPEMFKDWLLESLKKCQ